MSMESKKRKTEGNENGLGEEAEIDTDTARQMMEGFTREQLLDILADASAKHKDVAEQVRDIADADPALRKLFVRNLGFDTTTESFKGFFSQFGEIEEGVVIIDKRTGKSKGYGFLTFRHLDGALNALKEPSKVIDGRMTITRLASSQPGSIDVSDRKIFVGNVPTDMPSERLLSLFSEYGEIEEGPLGFDKQPGKSRSFALFIFKTAEGARLALEEPVKVVEGNKMFCKLASEGQQYQQQQQQQQRPPMNQPQMQSQPPPHHHLGSSMPMGGGYGNTGYNTYQGLNQNGMSRTQTPGNIPGGSMMHSANPSFMNQSLPSNPNPSNPVPSSMGMSGGYGGGYGAPQMGGYSGSQVGGAGAGAGAGTYGHMGAYGVPPAYGGPAPPSSGGFSETGRSAQPSYPNTIQHQQSGPPASRVPSGGMYPNAAQPFHPVYLIFPTFGLESSWNLSHAGKSRRKLSYAGQMLFRVNVLCTHVAVFSLLRVFHLVLTQVSKNSCDKQKIINVRKPMSNGAPSSFLASTKP